MAKKSTQTKAAGSAALLKILGDKNRFRALLLLVKARSGLTVGTLAERLGMSHSAASHLLSMLHNNDIVVFKKDGREVVYMVAGSPRAKTVMRILAAI